MDWLEPAICWHRRNWRLKFPKIDASRKVNLPIEFERKMLAEPGHVSQHGLCSAPSGLHETTLWEALARRHLPSKGYRVVFGVTVVVSAGALLQAMPECQAFRICGGHGASRELARSAEEASTQRSINSAVASYEYVPRCSASLNVF